MVTTTMTQDPAGCPGPKSHALGTAATEYVIGYAFSTSEAAVLHGYSAAGCFTVSVGTNTAAFATPAAASHAASLTGLKPGRWSIDHPDNRSLACASAFLPMPSASSLTPQ